MPCYNQLIAVAQNGESAMKTVLTKMVFVLIFISMSALSLGQGAPSQIDAALLDLSARLGYAVGIGNLSNWRWEQTNFPNDALGCPTATTAAALPSSVTNSS